MVIVARLYHLIWILQSEIWCKAFLLEKPENDRHFGSNAMDLWSRYTDHETFETLPKIFRNEEIENALHSKLKDQYNADIQCLDCGNVLDSKNTEKYLQMKIIYGTVKLTCAEH